MPSGYTRQSVAAIVNGNVINASDSNNEYNALLAAFNATTGHNHDGTTVGGGAPILAVNGVSYPSGASVNTVPVVTGSNVVTYEAVPNAALANSSITIGSTAFSLGATHTSISGLTLSAPTITNATTSGLFTLGGNIAAGGFSIVGPTLNSATTSGTFTLGGAMTATGFTITGGTFSGPALQSPALSGTASGTLGGGGTATLQNFILGTTITSGTLTLGATLNANTQSITNAVIAGPTINNATIGSGAGTGSALGANLTVTGFTIIGGGSATMQGVSLTSTCTGATASPSSNSTAIATTAFVASQFNESKGTNGWCQSGNGMPIMQWGRDTTSAAGNVTITFPTAFSTACWSIQITMINPTIPQILSSCSFSSSAITTTNFNANASQNGAAAALPFTWFAVGI